MRSREEIENEEINVTDERIVELLLDIRDLLLEKTKPKGKSREEWEQQF